MKKIKDISEVMELANQKKCVYTRGGHHFPAAFVISYQARYLFNQIESGFWYKKEENEKI